MKDVKVGVIIYEYYVDTDELTDLLQSAFNGKNVPAVRGVSTGTDDSGLVVCSEPLSNEAAQSLYDQIRDAYWSEDIFTRTDTTVLLKERLPNSEITRVELIIDNR